MNVPLPEQLVNAFDFFNDPDGKSGNKFNSHYVWGESVTTYTRNFSDPINTVLRLRGVMYIRNYQVYLRKDKLPSIREMIKQETNYDLECVVHNIASILYAMGTHKLQRYDKWGEEAILYRVVHELPHGVPLRVGSYFLDRGFMSTSYEKGALPNGDGNRGFKYLFVINAVSGFNIEKLSSRPWEKEVLLKPGTACQITKVEVDVEDDVYGTITRVHMREL